MDKSFVRVHLKPFLVNMLSDSNYEYLVVDVDGRVYNNNYFRYPLEINILEISNNTKLRYVEKMLLFFIGDVVFVRKDT